MKYIFLIALLFIGGEVGAVGIDDAININNKPIGGGVNTVSSFGSGLDTTTGGGSTGLDTTTGGGQSEGSGLDTTTGGGGLGASYDANNNFIGGNSGSPAVGKPAATLPGFILWAVQIMNYLVWAMMTLSLLFFLYGVFMLMFVGGANEESRTKGKKFMLWGILSLFVMVSVWGLVGVLKNSLFGEGDLIGPQFK